MRRLRPPEIRALAVLLDGPKPTFRFAVRDLRSWEQLHLIGYIQHEDGSRSVMITEAGRAALRALSDQDTGQGEESGR